MISYYVYRIFEKFILLLPRGMRKSIFTSLAKLLYLLATKHKKIIRQNLAFCYGDTLSEEKIVTISKNCFENLLLNILFFIEGQHRSNAEIFSDLTIENRHFYEDAIASNRPLIFVTAHFGLWEKGGAWLGVNTQPLVVYKPLKNSYFQNFLVQSRERFETKLIERKGALKHLFKALRKNGHTAMLFDQNSSVEDGVEITFFNQKVYQTASPAALARKTNALLIPIYIINEKDGTHKVTFQKSFDVAHSDDEANDIKEASQEISDSLELMIKTYPEQWFWCHRRFKSTHPEIYS